MKCYQIQETLKPIEFEKRIKEGAQYVIIVTPDEWKKDMERFDLGIDLELNYSTPHVTKAESNYDSITGSMFIPRKYKSNEESHAFAFALDEKGIVFIDKDEFTGEIISYIEENKKTKMPGLERFLYDFLEKILYDDMTMLEQYEKELDGIETDIVTLKKGSREITTRIHDIRGELLDYRTYYEQLAELSQELEENENGFFNEDNLRYFNLLKDRVMRLQDMVTTLRDYSVQLRELHQAQLSMKQNRIVTLLTVVTAIFVPLSLLTSWYGMNFKDMPELDSKYGYPGVIIASVVIVVISLLVIKIKKWL